MAEHIFERLARERGITVEEMRAIISTRIEKGWNDPMGILPLGYLGCRMLLLWQRKFLHWTKWNLLGCSP